MTTATSSPKRRATKSRPAKAKPRAVKAKPSAVATKPSAAKAEPSAVATKPRAAAKKPRAAAKTSRAAKSSVAKSPAAMSRRVALTCFVYVLGSFHKGRYISYVGWTNDVARRLDKHNAGTGARTTRGRAWTLLHTEAFATRNEAMSREWHLKRDRAFRKRLMDDVKAASQWNDVSSPRPVLTGRGRIANGSARSAAR